MRLTVQLCVSRRSDIPGELIPIKGCFFLGSLICPPDVLRSHDASLCSREEECSVFTFLLSSGLTPKVSPQPRPPKNLIINYTLSGLHDHHLLTRTSCITACLAS